MQREIIGDVFGAAVGRNWQMAIGKAISQINLGLSFGRELFK
jgi:hypothetical protein